MGDDFRVEYPTGSGTEVRLRDVAEDIARRLVSIWLDDENGRRPVFGAYEKFQTDPDWHDLLWFHEYFHGDTGAGIGASHQTGWTGIVAHLLCQNGIIDAIDSGRSTARMGLKPSHDRGEGEEGLSDGRRAPVARPVRADGQLPFHLPAPVDGAGTDARHPGRHLHPDQGSEVAPPVVLLGQGLRADLRARRRDGDRPGIRVRDELGRLLPVRRQRVRQPAGGRGRLRVLPRGRVPRADALRRQPAGPAALAVLDLHGRLRGAFQRALDPDGQLLDADAAGLRDRQQPGA